MKSNIVTTHQIVIPILNLLNFNRFIFKRIGNRKKYVVYTLFFIGLLILNSFQATAQNCAVNAGVDQTICVTSSLTLTGVAGNPQSVPALTQWTQLSGPTATITSPNALSTTITGFTPGNYVFQLSNRCSDNLLSKDIVAITVLPVPPTSLAGPDITQCTNSAVTLNANAVTAPNVGTWTVLPAGGTFSPNANAPNATYTPPAGAVTYTLTWTISNGSCSTSDAMLLNIVSPTSPVNAGSDISLSCNGSCVTLNGSNPGLAPPQGGFWTVISGPNTPVISSPTLRNSTVCGLIPGSYTLRWTVSGPCLSGSDDVVINVANTLSPPVAQAAQTYTTFCGSPAVTSQVLNGAPLTAGETALWTQTSPATPAATFGPGNTVASVTVGNLTGVFPYTFNYVRTNASGCTATSTHTVYRSPSITNLSTPADIDLACDVTSTTFTITYDNLTSVNNGITRNGTKISGPAGVGTITFTTTTTAAGTRTDTWTASGMTTLGTYVYRMEYTNSCGTQFRDIAITVSQTPGVINGGSDPLLPCNTLFANLIGSAATPGTIAWSQVSGPNTATLAGVTTTSLTMTGLTQGVYTMRFSISGGKACPAKSDIAVVKVTTSVPTVVTTDVDATICAGNVRLKANTPGGTDIGTWTVTPSTGITFAPNANTPNAIASGLAANTAYTFRWTISNGCGSIYDELVLTTTNVQGPPVPNAGADQCLATGTTSATLTGNAPAGSTILWTALDAGSSVASPSTQTTNVTLTGSGTYRFVYTLSKVSCTSISDTVTVTVNQTITANAGADQDICAPTIPASATITATAPPAGTTGVWSQLTGPVAATLATPGNNSSAVSGLQPGIYSFEYRISIGGICADKTDTVVIRVVSEPSAAAAGPDQSLCNVTTATNITLAATPPATGTGYWMVVSGPPGSTPAFSNNTLANSTFSNLMNGSYTLRWTTTNGAGCADKTDDVVINVTAAANAKPDFTLCNATTTNLTGNANTTGTWTYISGPAGTTITTNSPNTAVVSGLVAPGPGSSVYTFRYSIPAVGSCPATTDDVLVTNYPTPSLANAGADAELCFNTNTITLTGNTPTVGTGSWVRESGPNTPTAGTANGNAIDTALSNMVAGIYIYQYQINTNAACNASIDRMQIIKERAANAGTDIRVCNSTTVNLSATAGVVNAGAWSYVSGPAGSAFANAVAPNTAVNGLVPGTYVFRWTISSPISPVCATNSDDVQVIIDPAVAAMNAGADVTFCEGSVAPFVIGSAAQTGVTYTWMPALLLSNAGIAQPTFNGVNNAGTYNYTVKGSIGTCEAFDAIAIKVNPKPFANINASAVSCPSIFTASDPGAGVNSPAYTWDFGTGAVPATATGAGPHSVTYPTPGVRNISLSITTGDGCSNAVISSINTCIALPILISRFQAQWKDGYSLLNWLAELPVNFNRFEIERSIDGVVFNKIGQTDFVLNQSVYTYEDKTVSASAALIYYRLKLVDGNGTYNYSTVVAVRTSGNNKVNFYPNPADDLVTIELGDNAKGNYTLQLIDALGREVNKIVVFNAQSNQLVKIKRASNVGAGMYILKISSSYYNQSSVSKIIYK